MNRVLVTGASGFIGRHLCEGLRTAVGEVIGAVRVERQLAQIPAGVQGVAVGDLTEHALRSSLIGVDTVIHLAARVHVMNGNNKGEEQYRRSNVAATESLSNCAALAGVRRFVFVSTAKVLGESSSRPLSEADQAAPADPYARSKYDAERLLQQVADRTGMEVAIVRPPLVYGPGVGANFLRLLVLAQLSARIPMPLRGIQNRRSMVFVRNLVDALELCARHEKAACTYLVTDDVDLSTSELFESLSVHLNGRPRTFKVPETLLRGLAISFGKGPEMQRLLGSFLLDCGKIRRELGWRPPYSQAEGLRETCEWYRESFARSREN